MDASPLPDTIKTPAYFSLPMAEHSEAIDGGQLFDEGCPVTAPAMEPHSNFR
jgi:hypothetical protein